MISYLSDSFNSNYSQEGYNKEICNLDYSKIICSCGCKGRFHKHATYPRYVQLAPNKTILLNVQRVKCDICGTTHVLLPSFIIPYRITSAPMVNTVIYQFFYENLSYTQIAKLTHFSFEYVKHLCLFFLRYHKQRFLAFLASHIFSSFDSFEFISVFHFENKVFFMQRVPTNDHLLHNYFQFP